jgi:anti-sigma regulatory factor (Ser/Thr protein kinase)
MIPTVRSLRVDADLGSLAEVRRFVRSAAADAGAPAECLEDLVQAVDEAATNTIVHGYDGAPGWLEVGAGLEDGRFVIRLQDAAPEFDPTSVPEPDLSVPPMHRKPGGMGVHLIRACTDAMSYRPRPGGGNILTLVHAVGPDWKKEG